MRILLLDIETAPNLAYVWGLWKENVGTNQIVNSGYILSWAAKWHGEKGPPMFDSIMQSSERKMLGWIHDLLNMADVVVHYNGQSFDIPTLNKEFVIHGFGPPAPYKQIDLLKIIREKFRFPSNKLDYVSQTLEIGEKVRHEGFELWVKCMAKDQKAWARMKVYNMHDVVLLEKLYDRILPWITNHPNRSAYLERPACTNCGSSEVTKRGYAVTRQMKYQRYQCQNCGTWSRGTKSIKVQPGERLVSVTS